MIDDPFSDENDILLFAPTLDDPEDTYFLQLKGTLTYEGVLVDTAYEPFTVVVDGCFASLDLSLVSLPEITNVWYAANKPYDVSFVYSQVIPSVECNFPYFFDVCVIETDEFGVQTELPLPPEITFTFDPVSQYVAFDIAKCDPIGVDLPDSECNNGFLPYNKNWDLQMKIGIQFDDGSESSGFVPLIARIEDPCPFDTVNFVELEPSVFDYYLRSSPDTYTYEVKVS